MVLQACKLSIVTASLLAKHDDRKLVLAKHGDRKLVLAKPGDHMLVC